MKLCFILILLSPLFSSAQEKRSYEINGKSIEFTISENQYFIKFQETDRQWIESKGKDFSFIMENYATIKFTDSSHNNFITYKANIQQEYQDKLLDIEPVLIYKDGTKAVCKGELIIKMKPTSFPTGLFSGYSYTYQKDQFHDFRTDTRSGKLYFAGFYRPEHKARTHYYRIINKNEKTKKLVWHQKRYMRFIPTTIC